MNEYLVTIKAKLFMKHVIVKANSADQVLLHAEVAPYLGFKVTVELASKD